MSILDSLAARLGYAKAPKQAAEVPGILLSEAGAYKWNMPSAMVAEKQAMLYAQLTWIATAIDWVAELGSAGKFCVKKTGTLLDSDEDDEEIPNHPFELLLRRPNPMQSGGEFLRDALAWYKTTGNLYVFKNAVDENTPPDEIWTVPSTMLEPIPDGRSYISGYRFMVPGKSDEIIPIWQIMHLKTWNPLNPFIGLSAVQSLALDAYGDLAQQKWNVKLFDKDNGKLPIVLAFKHMIGDPQWKEIQRQRDEEWGGSNRPGVMLLRGVEDTMQLLQAGASQKEMDFLAGRNFTKEEIYGKLAPGLASILAVNATEANAIAGKSTLIEFGVWPLLDKLAQKFVNDMLPIYGDGLVGEFEDMRQTNRVLDLQEQAEYAKYHTINEIRAEYYQEEPMYLDDDLVLQEQVTVRESIAATTPPQGEQGIPGQDSTKAQKAKKPKLDPRGFLLPAQVGPNTGAPGEKILKPPQATPPQLAPATVPPDQSQTAGQQPAQPAQPDAAAQAAEMKAWEKYAINHLGKRGREFEVRAIEYFKAGRIKAALAGADTEEKVRAVFEREQEQPSIADAITELRRFNDIASAS